MGFLFLLIQLFWVLAHSLSGLFGSEFYLYNEAVYWAVSGALSVLLWKLDRKQPSYWNIVFFPITVLCCAAELLFTRTPLGVPFAIVRCLCAYAYLSPLPEKWPKYLAKGINVLLILGFLGICGFDLTFGSIGKTTVIQETQSPGGAYTAQLIDDDQGALGGNTLVKVFEKDSFSLLVGGIRPKSKTVYRGPWGEFKSIDLVWENEYTILIHGKAYLIGTMEAEYCIQDTHYLTSDERIAPYRCRFTEEALEIRKDSSGDFEAVGKPEPYPLTITELNDYTAAERCWIGPKLYSSVKDAYIVRMEDDHFYLIFRTKNGKTYLGYGWEDLSERWDGASDDTGLYQLYRIEGIYE